MGNREGQVISTIADVWDDPLRPWPSIVYVETTNLCNARCTSCLNQYVKRPRVTMSQADFERVVDKVKDAGLKIGALFCFGEPLMDPGLLDKFDYARRKRALSQHVGLNTNVSHLTPDKWDAILRKTPNIILSFFNVGDEFNRLTGTLDWEDCYSKAVRFIEYRDRTSSGYPIYISVNKVAGHNLEAVKRAFEGYRVQFVQDAELRYEGGRCVDGVIDRMIMFPGWRCDGYKGALQVKPDGGAEFCAYDIIGTDAGVGETRFGHFLADDWATLTASFREHWRAGSSLCRRCDYWYLCKRVLANGCKAVGDMSWPKPGGAHCKNESTP